LESMEKNELIKSAYIACKDGKIESALKHYQQVYKIDPTDAGILCMMGYCYTKLGQPSESLKQYRRALLIGKKQKNQLKIDIIQKNMIRIDPDSVADFEVFLVEASMNVPVNPAQQFDTYLWGTRDRIVEKLNSEQKNIIAISDELLKNI